MENRKDIKGGGQDQFQPTDQGEDSEERREAAEKAWNDRAGVPRGTPEQGEETPDQVGGGKTAQPGRETDEPVEPGQKRAPEVDDVDDIDEKR